MPMVQLGLQTITFCQQGHVFGRQVLHDCIKSLPKVVGADARIWQNLGLDEVVQVGGDLQAMNSGAWLHGIGHGASQRFKSTKGKKAILGENNTRGLNPPRAIAKLHFASL